MALPDNIAKKLADLKAEGDAKRGRPLTDAEMVNNLMEAVWSCDRCDRQIETGWQFCPSCGWQLVEDDELKEVTR